MLIDIQQITVQQIFDTLTDKSIFDIEANATEAVHIHKCLQTEPALDAIAKLMLSTQLANSLKGRNQTQTMFSMVVIGMQYGLRLANKLMVDETISKVRDESRQ